MANVRAGLMAVAGLMAATALPGCYAEAGAPVMVTSADVDPYYTPAYYDGYVVYYDGYGRPYYYDRGAVVWVSPASPHYGGLVHHWHVYGGGYARWNAHYGPRYYRYRAAPGYHVYHGYHAPPARRGPPPRR